MTDSPSRADLFNGICVLMPTYNNAGTLLEVVERVQAVLRSAGAGSADRYRAGLRFDSAQHRSGGPAGGPAVIIVDDGSTDATADLLRDAQGVHVVRIPQNRGKGNALRVGFNEALKLGYRNAITIDSDGQHDPSDLVAMARAIQEDPTAMVMGARDMDKLEVPGRSSFGNRFSNFWFKVETGITLPDTQTGYRGWPLHAVHSFRTISDRFGYEVESIVKLAWRGTKFRVVPVSVRYDFPERVSHFKPFLDFTRISFLNTWLVTLAIVWYWPKRLFNRRDLRARIRAEAVRPGESSLRKALSIGFGLFMGIVPIWGFQLLVGIPLAYLFNLNRVLFLVAAHISIPPMIPLIIYVSYRVGAWFLPASRTLSFDLENVSMATIHENVVQYAVGAMVLALIAGIAGWLVSWPVISAVRKKH